MLVTGSTRIPHTGSTTGLLICGDTSANERLLEQIDLRIFARHDHRMHRRRTHFPVALERDRMPFSTSCLRSLVVHPSWRVMGLTTVLIAATTGFEL